MNKKELMRHLLWLNSEFPLQACPDGQRHREAFERGSQEDSQKDKEQIRRQEGGQEGVEVSVLRRL